ncbi:MAG TPA: phenylalanine--tRNA ligase subunit alpha, partial [Sphingomicrobium sp.]|nr:phenylalanine--tRNA ligase subunit alpha [Sphingomicrobium sp.]
MSAHPLQARFSEQIAAAADLAALDSVRVAALGKSGEITELLKSLGRMDAGTRMAEAPKIHALREAITEAIAAKKAALEDEELERRLATEKLDLSLPASEYPRGSVHPVSQVLDELTEIFADLGFAVAEGPEIEDDWHNFTALNIPETHPARAMHDTFYVDPGSGSGAGGDSRMVLRTHTSPVQIRTMQGGQPPFRVIAPGRVYRSDSDATHTPMFHQIEGLVIDEATHMGHLKGCIVEFVRAFFGVDDLPVRF